MLYTTKDKIKGGFSYTKRFLEPLISVFVPCFFEPSLFTGKPSTWSISSGFLVTDYRCTGWLLCEPWIKFDSGTTSELKNKPGVGRQRPTVDKQTNPLAPLATLTGLILVTRHTMRSVNGSTAVWTSLFWNREADRARDESIASERSVGGIANRVNGHGTATSLLWISEGIEAGGNFPVELFASSDGHSGNHCSALSFF